MEFKVQMLGLERIRALPPHRAMGDTPSASVMFLFNLVSFADWSSERWQAVCVLARDSFRGKAFQAKTLRF